jgi:hypothetical protein
MEPLDDVEHSLAIIEARRWPPLFGPAQVTAAYGRFAVAWGAAKVGQRARAEELARSATAALAPVANDPVHAYAIAAYTIRLQHAFAGVPRTAPLPDHVGRMLYKPLDRKGRYIVSRLREASPILVGGATEVDTIHDWIRCVTSPHDQPRDPVLAAIRAIADPHARAAHIASAPADELASALTALLELPAELAVPVLAGIAMPSSAAACANACVAAAHFGVRERVPDLVNTLRAKLAPSDGAVVGPTIRALRKLDMLDEVRALLADAQRVVEPKSIALELTIAGGLALLGDPAVFAAARTGYLAREMTHPMRLELMRAIAIGASHASHDVGSHELQLLAAELPKIFDSYGTNTHFCMSILHAVESIVLGLVDLSPDGRPPG